MKAAGRSLQPAVRLEFAVLVSVDAADHVVQLVIAHDAVAARGIFGVDHLFHPDDEAVALVDLVLVWQVIIVVDPVSDAREPARVVDGDARRAAEDLFGIEDVVDLGIFEHAVRMDARAGGVERAPDEGRCGGDDVAELGLEIARDVGNGGKIHAVVRAAQRSVFDGHRFERAVARALADAEQRAVDRARAVQPRRGGVGDDFIKIVVAVPLEQFAGHFGMVMQAVYQPLHAARDARAGVIDAEAHRVAHADLDGDAALARELHQFVRERHDEAVEIGAREIFEMAARLDAVRQRALDDAEVLIHRLRAGEVHLFEDVVVGTAHKDARFRNARLLDELEVLFVGADPRRDLGELQPQILTGFERGAVLFAVQEKFALPHDALRPAQTRHQLVQIDDLLHGKGRGGLLPVAEGGIGDPDLRGHVHGDVAVVENHLRDLLVGINVAEQLGFGHVLQLIVVFILFEQVFAFVEVDHGLKNLLDELFDAIQPLGDILFGDGIGEAHALVVAEGDAGHDRDPLFEEHVRHVHGAAYLAAVEALAVQLIHHQHDVEGAVRLDAAQAVNLADALDHEFAAVVEDVAHLHELLLAAVQGGEGRVLRDARRVARGVALEGIDGLGDLLRGGEPADAPARHRVRLGDAVDDDRMILHPLADLRHGEVLYAVVDELGIDLVGEHPNARLFAHRGQGADLRLGVHRARGVGGRVEDEHLRLGGDRLFEVFGGDLEVVLLVPLDEHARAAAHLDHFGVGQPVRGRDDDLVPLLDEREHRVEDGVLRARRDDDLRRVVVEPLLLFELFGDLLAQRGKARGRGVFGAAVVQRLFRRVDDVLRGIEVGFARAETDDGLPFRLHRLCLGGDRKGQRGRNGRNALCRVHKWYLCIYRIKY